MTDEQLTLVKNKIYLLCGIILAKIQISQLELYIEERCKVLNLSLEEFIKGLESTSQEFKSLVNKITVNETYFFREQKQFEFLRDEVFPLYKGKPFTIWSAACSTGEEPISLLALALECGVDATVYATDIDEDVIKFFKKGVYPEYSFRADGAEFHPILEKYGKKKNGQFIVNPDFIDRIRISLYNLLSSDNPPVYEGVNLIFMRNVFIYFDEKGRTQVSKKVCAQLLEGGLLFYSMNEIGSITQEIIPKGLSKLSHKSVYYFKKDFGKGPGLSALENLRLSVKTGAESKNTYGKTDIKTLAAQIKGKHPSAPEKPVLNSISSQKLMEASLQQAGAKLNEKIKGIFEQVCAEINQMNYIKALEIAKQPCTYLESPYFVFMQGYVEYHADNKSSAEILFSSVEIQKADFWPAYFYHGMTQRDFGKTEKSIYCFKKCRQLLESFGKDNPYDFLLDSFSPSYICSLCQKFEKEGAL